MKIIIISISRIISANRSECINLWWFLIAHELENFGKILIPRKPFFFFFFLTWLFLFRENIVSRGCHNCFFIFYFYHFFCFDSFLLLLPNNFRLLSLIVHKQFQTTVNNHSKVLFFTYPHLYMLSSTHNYYQPFFSPGTTVRFSQDASFVTAFTLILPQKS